VDILSDLELRGLLHDTTDRAALARRLDDGPIVLYCGFDPTADSLHVGNLVGLLTLRRFQEAGHIPITLAGGATGMVGDPSGRSAERNLLGDDDLARNLEGIVPQLRQFLDFEPGPTQARLLDNRAWTVGVGVLDFLRDVGKHVTVNQMLGKESVKNRLGSGDGLSFTEFSYMLLQGYDYLWLAEHQRCELQIGGSDQWGNIVLGVDLIRRKLGSTAHALTFPLLTRSDGSKYGKTAGGDTLWLDPAKMSPYRFYQAWIPVEDDEVGKLLRQLTFLDLGEIDAILEAHGSDPGARLAQRTLARELTTIVHGPDAAEAALQASGVLFGTGSEPADASPAALEFLAGEVPTSVLGPEVASVLDAVVDVGLVKSRAEGKRAIAEGSVYLNGQRVGDVEAIIEPASFLHGRYLLLRRGKRQWHLATRT